MKHKRFIYHDYSITKSGFSYHFSMDEYDFRPSWSCNIENPQDPILRELVFHLGMVELVSYWKSACPPTVEVQCGTLDDWQIKWWKKLYLNGLGEFFYINKINPTDDFMTIIPINTKKPIPSPEPPSLSGCLIPVGGGKDSIVTLELIREIGGDNCCYIVGDIKRAYDSAKTAGYPDPCIIKVSRTIDPILLELNKKGYLNGHTPFSAIIAFSSLIFAYLNGKKYIVLSNESSANEGNCQLSTATNSGLLSVNHQYSKSTEFERDFIDYVCKINDTLFPRNSDTNTQASRLPQYFSLLRTQNELQITRKFTQYPQYFPVFQSCNVGTKSNTWCCKCAKCLYIYVMLAAFLEDDALIGIFGENLLDNPDLSGLLDALMNPEYDKPFECVGTREEINHALYLAMQKRGNNLPLLLKGRVDVIKPPGSDLLSFYDNHNFIPREFLKLL